MTREKAVRINHLLGKIEDYEALLEDIPRLEFLAEISAIHGTELEDELCAIVQAKLDKLLKELEEI